MKFEVLSIVAKIMFFDTNLWIGSQANTPKHRWSSHSRRDIVIKRGLSVADVINFPRGAYRTGNLTRVRVSPLVGTMPMIEQRNTNTAIGYLTRNQSIIMAFKGAINPNELSYRPQAAFLIIQISIHCHTF